ncbi:MAG: class I SAM-dependent methyltransferase [Candidatus Hinthialibacter antarcticus]|nr:class I SAM-dependent methyltransferase [Candidatus Hinthialibacter antarcticus]
MIVDNATGTDTDVFLEVSDDIGVDFPDKKFTQDEEFCTISLDGVEKRIRFHDYDEIYSIPGLYEKIFYDHLRCCSPETVCDFFFDEIRKRGLSEDQLRVLEIGSGNGMVGELMKQHGVSFVVGVDILIEAKLAAYRDRPNVYDDYFAIDLTDIPESIEEDILMYKLNSLVSVAALGFDDLPPLAYARAFNLISKEGWIAFNIKDLFLSGKDSSGFSRLFKKMIDNDIVSIHVQEKYQHRVATDNSPLYYYAIVAQKLADIPRAWLAEMA